MLLTLEQILEAPSFNINLFKQTFAEVIKETDCYWFIHMSGGIVHIMSHAVTMTNELAKIVDVNYETKCGAITMGT